MVTYLGGPLDWCAVREGRTSRNVCESEIKAMDEACKLIEHVRLFLEDLGSPEPQQPTKLEAPILFADKKGGVDWAHSSAITNRLRYMNIREVAIRDAITAGEVQLGHIPGAINQSDVFTKEHKDMQHYIRLRGSIMSPRQP